MERERSVELCRSLFLPPPFPKIAHVLLSLRLFYFQDVPTIWEPGTGYHYHYSKYSFFFLSQLHGIRIYLKYLLHFWRKITDFPCLLLFSTPFSKRMLYFDPSEFLIPVFFFRFTLTSRNCFISFKMRPRKKTKIAHSRPLNGMLDVSRQRAKWKPSSTR